MIKSLFNTGNLKSKSFLLLAVIALQGCIFPKSPGSGTARKTTPLDKAKVIDWVEMAPYRTTQQVAGGKHTVTRTHKRTKNLLFIAADDVVGKKLGPELKKIYKKDVRLEDALWWFYAPKIQKTYNNVLRMHWNAFNAKSFKAALDTMESLKVPYDVMLLAHGIPNHLIASPGQGVISFREVAKLKNKLKYADHLYLQACFGDTLEGDFLDAGFNSVVAYEGLNWNFFYPDYFLEAMATHKGNAEKAHDDVVEHFNKKFKWSLMDREIVKRVFGDKPKEYLEDVQLPEFYN